VPDPVTVAVVTRTQDRAILLDRAVRSVMQQTLTDLHMVIVDDGGDAAAVDAVVEARSDQTQGRVSVVHHESARGMEAATNAGLQALDSTFVAILDDDDSWHPTFLERTVGELERTGAMGVVTDTQAVYEDTDYGDIRYMESFLFDPLADVHLGTSEHPRPPTSLVRLLSGNQFPPCAFVYRRLALDEVGTYDETLPVLGDWDFNIRFQLRYDVDHIPEPLAYYHHRKGESAELGNSVSKDDLHDRTRQLLLNRYLRHDLERGTFGVGVLASLLHEWRQQSVDTGASMAARLESIDASIGALSDRLDQAIGLVGGAAADARSSTVAEGSGRVAHDPSVHAASVTSARRLLGHWRRQLLGADRPTSEQPPA
jgi:glycosyltransferase involved in cell wall biosynthesis